MANLCLGALRQLQAILLASDGVNAALGTIGSRDGVHLPSLQEGTVLLQNVASDLADENVPAVYPAVYLYCDRMENLLLEKFARFSGPVFLVADVRVSAERLTGLGEQVAQYVEAVTSVLATNRGQWSENLAYSGAYTVEFGEVQLGGQNFIQSAAIEVELQAHE